MKKLHGVVVLILISVFCSFPQKAFSDDVSTNKTPFILRPGFHGSQDRNQGYMDMLLPLHQDGQQLFFLNPKFVISDSNDNEQNIGLGYRRFMLDNTAIGGANLFYDTRRSPHDNRFHQVGLGGEWLSKWFDARVNGYIALSDEEDVGASPLYSFSGTQVVLNHGRAFEEPLSGIDYEIGVMVPIK